MNYSKNYLQTQSLKNVLLILVLSLTFSCSQPKSEPINLAPADLHAAMQKLTDIMVHDIFSPPQASRTYLYPVMAAYEIARQSDARYQSLHGQANGFPLIEPLPGDTDVNARLASLIAFLEISRKLVFSEELITGYRDSLYLEWKSLNPAVFEASEAYANQVLPQIIAWIDDDYYLQTRTLPKYSVDLNEPWRWQPTPPSYMDGIEPHWRLIRPVALDSAAQFRPEPHPQFSLEKGSRFYTEVMEVYEANLRARSLGDASEEVQIAQFWDCNPYVSVHRGHMLFAVKKITPGGHWIGISGLAARQAQLDFMETLEVYFYTSAAIFDGFISCWEEKYHSNLTRPETLINQFIDETWEPLLQTPPFPEYTSGHSVISNAAAEVLTAVLGDNFAFDDTVEIPYGLPVRSFTSFNHAAQEAAISRLYGGIHYRSAIDNGAWQGRAVGRHLLQTIRLKNEHL